MFFFFFSLVQGYFLGLTIPGKYVKFTRETSSEHSVCCFLEAENQIFFFFLNLKIRVDHGTEDYDVYRSWQKASKQVRNTRGIKLFQHYFENSTCMALYNLTYLWHIKHDMI